MKYFFIILILVFSLNSIADEKKLEHFCKMDTKFYETDKNEWSQKIIDYDCENFYICLTGLFMSYLFFNTM